MILYRCDNVPFCNVPFCNLVPCCYMYHFVTISFSNVPSRTTYRFVKLCHFETYCFVRYRCVTYRFKTYRFVVVPFCNVPLCISIRNHLFLCVVFRTHCFKSTSPIQLPTSHSLLTPPPPVVGPPSGPPTASWGFLALSKRKVGAPDYGHGRTRIRQVFCWSPECHLGPEPTRLRTLK
jgi:hypothetical protein